MKHPIDYVRRLPELNQHDLSLAGGKAAALGEMLQAGFPVPNGFCLTTRAYRTFVQKSGLDKQIKLGLEGEELRKKFASAPIPAEILTQVEAAYHELNVKAVSVRSSSTAEDLPQASFAGQQDTYLNVRGLKETIKAIRKCWASLWTKRVIEYRERAGFPPDSVDMGIVVQAMVNAEKAGVLFSANPVTGNRDQVVINGAWGLGEAIVSGLVTPDTITIDKTNGQIISANIAQKTVMTVRTDKGTEERAVPKDKQAIPVLSGEEIIRLVELSAGVEAHENRPMDLEWAIEGNRLYLLQARPITALPEPLDDVDINGGEWSRLMLIERYPDPLTPYTASVMQSAFFQSFDKVFSLMGGKPSGDEKMIGMFFGLPYINVTMMGKAGIQTGNEINRNNNSPRKKPGLITLTKVGWLLLNTHREWNRLQTRFETKARQINEKSWHDAPLSRLLEETENQEPRIKPMLNNHAYAIIAAELTLQMLKTLTRNWLGDDKGHLSTTLLSGLTGNMTVKTNHALWKLAVLVRPHEELRAYLSQPPQDNWRQEVVKFEGGEEFIAELDRFLRTYGHRSPRYEFIHPCWAEEPKQVIEMVQMYFDEAVQDPAIGESAQAAKREAAQTNARQKLPLSKRFIFDRVLSLAQTYFRLRENQQFYLMMMLPTQQRILQAMGQNLVLAGCFDAPGDIYFLQQDEGVALARHVLAPQPNSAEKLARAQAQVQKNRSDLARYQRMNAPLHLGGKPQDTGTGQKIVGIAASKGIARGPVRIILEPGEFRDLQPGEILVTSATSPAWTPLFGVAGGLITDFGGMLSHSGVVAREYGLPAVLGVGNATATLKNGQIVEIDGTAGTVRKIGDDT